MVPSGHWQSKYDDDLQIPIQQQQQVNDQLKVSEDVLRIVCIVFTTNQQYNLSILYMRNSCTDKDVIGK